jgi:hypothetical protein
MITTPGSDSQEVGPLADRVPRKRSTRFVARRRAETAVDLVHRSFELHLGLAGSKNRCYQPKNKREIFVGYCTILRG